MSSKSVSNISKSELDKLVKEELVFKVDAYEQLLARVEVLAQNPLSDKEVIEMKSLIAEVEELKTKYDMMIYNELKKSNGRVDNFGIPISFNFESGVPIFLESKDTRKIVGGIIGRITKEQQEDLSDEEFKTLNVQVLDVVIPMMYESMGKHLGDMFQKSIGRMKDLIDDSVLPTNKFHFKTLEECAVHFSNLAHYGHYPTKRSAWRDAVKRGITYSKNRIKISKFQDLERALERVRDAHKQKELGLL